MTSEWRIQGCSNESLKNGGELCKRFLFGVMLSNNNNNNNNNNNKQG